MNVASLLVNTEFINLISSLLLVLFVPISIWVVRVWNTTQIELLLIPLHRRILHDLSQSVIYSISMIAVITFLANRSTSINKDILGFLGILSVTLFLVFVIIIVVHSLLHSISTHGVKFKRTFRGIAITGLIIFFVAIYSVNVSFIITNVNTEQIIMVIILEILMLILSMQLMPYYIKLINHSGYYFEVETFNEEEIPEKLRGMVLINSIQTDVQIMKKITDENTFDNDPNKFPMYVYYVQTNRLQKYTYKKVEYKKG